MSEFIRCKKCIMDNVSDPSISFYSNGYCNYCTSALNKKKKIYFPNEDGKLMLNNLIRSLKINGKGKKFDCLMGLSGGLDSSYLLYLGYKYGLRIAVIHIDDGFDTEVSKNNIDKLISKTGYDLVTIKPDQEQYYSLLRGYMEAGVPNLAVPQDNILSAFIYDYAKKNNIKTFLSGWNFALESIIQKGNTHDAFDLVNLMDINNKFNKKSVDKLKFISNWKRFYDMKVLGIKTNFLLNYVPYERNTAFKELNEFCGFQYYGRKHLENIFTAFVQCYWLPQKFNVDKRTSHLSSMIISGQLSREEALREYSEPIIEIELIEEYINVIKEKLNINNEEWNDILKRPSRQHTFYKTDHFFPYAYKIYDLFR